MYFRIIADFEADNEVDGSSLGKKTKNIYKQNPVLNSYYILSELEDVLESGYYECPVGYDSVDWFVNVVITLQNKMSFYFKNTKKDIIMTQEVKEDFDKNNSVDFVRKKYYLINFVIIAT